MRKFGWNTGQNRIRLRQIEMQVTPEGKLRVTDDYLASSDEVDYIEDFLKELNNEELTPKDVIDNTEKYQQWSAKRTLFLSVLDDVENSDKHAHNWYGFNHEPTTNQKARKVLNKRNPFAEVTIENQNVLYVCGDENPRLMETKMRTGRELQVNDKNHLMLHPTFSVTQQDVTDAHFVNDRKRVIYIQDLYESDAKVQLNVSVNEDLLLPDVTDDSQDVFVL